MVADPAGASTTTAEGKEKEVKKVIKKKLYRLRQR